jgi:DNA-binding transcriptional LysR family regulator
MIQTGESIEIAELLAFTRAVDAKSLSRAAAELRVPRATIGRRLARLEEKLGTRLIRRTTRSLSLTDAGETFYRQARIALDAVGQAQASVRAEDSVIRGEVRVSVTSNLDESFSEMITAFMKAYRMFAYRWTRRPASSTCGAMAMTWRCGRPERSTRDCSRGRSDGTS